MKGEVIKIKFIGEYASISENNRVKISDLFSDDTFMSKRHSNSESFLEVKIINYALSKNEISVEILRYNQNECHFNHNQILLSKKLSLIKNVKIRDSDTLKIMEMFRDNVKGFRSNHKKERNTERIDFRGISKEERSKNNIEKQSIEKIENDLIPKEKIISKVYQISFKRITFEFGRVSFKKWIEELGTEKRIEIINDNIKEEYDSIKDYFSNVLKKEKIVVSVKLVLLGGVVKKIEAKSKEIDRINDELFENIRFEFIRKTKKNNIENDRSIFTMDEYFDTFADKKLESSIFYSEETDFFNDLIKISDTKHYKNLRFLSRKHTYKVMKLRFVHKPFSFLFVIEGEHNHHIIWETLDTEEATYIWHIEKSLDALKQKIKKLDKIINTIKVEGKLPYINSKEDGFERIYHDYSEKIDGFVKWKGELKNILT